MKGFKILRMYYSPGYGDMLGGYHYMTLEKDKNGKWTLSSEDREEHGSPKIKSVYAVDADAFADFERFVEERKVLSLERRPKSSIFVTDYSPWRFFISYYKTSFGKEKLCSCTLDEYKRYGKRDFDLIDELKRRFVALYREKISETILRE